MAVAKHVQHKAMHLIGQFVYYWSKIEREITMQIYLIETKQMIGEMKRLDGDYEVSWPPHNAKFNFRFRTRLDLWRKLWDENLDNESCAILDGKYQKMLELCKLRDDLVHNCVAVNPADDDSFNLHIVETIDLKSWNNALYNDGPAPDHFGVPREELLSELDVANASVELKNCGVWLEQLRADLLYDPKSQETQVQADHLAALIIHTSLKQ